MRFQSTNSLDNKSIEFKDTHRVVPQKFLHNRIRDTMNYMEYRFQFIRQQQHGTQFDK